ncbi:hypothetical protein PVAP13_7KG025329 [Panicum virgatum]|uniref:Uncharacterized protein n=1 Tax=Panicum virgatum TaxID=38727 RepID=A0A8T0QJM7_PANVG|nr:hypothetical protein PVAP13_7KG025329 [Panicum virgatum]
MTARSCLTSDVTKGGYLEVGVTKGGYLEVT